MPDDEVIDAADSDQSSGLDHPLRHLDIFPAWCRVTRWMIMDGNEACRRTADGFTENITGMDDRRIETADKQRLFGNDFVFRVQIQTDEMFLLIQAHLLHQ